MTKKQPGESGKRSRKHDGMYNHGRPRAAQSSARVQEKRMIPKELIVVYTRNLERKFKGFVARSFVFYLLVPIAQNDDLRHHKDR